MNLFKFLMNYFFPVQCIFCDKTMEINAVKAVCPECEAEIAGSKKKLCCAKCGKPVVSYGKRKICYFCYDNKTKYFDRIVSAFEYGGKVKESVLRYKGKGYQSYAPLYAEYMAETVREYYGDLKFDIMCGAPSHKDKKREQGFDNVELIGEFMQKKLKIPFVCDGIKKIRMTPRQTGLKYRERQENLKNSMTADEAVVGGKNVLLIDDVCTTRATIIECSRALKAAGAKKVYAVTFATTVRKIEKIISRKLMK